jgi:ADP-ribose pyrophosphatase YjhB (NUDIX family)
MHSSPSSADAAPRAAVSGAIFRGGEVLLVQRSKAPALGLWSLPGGHIEPGEAAVDAVHRELREETGVEARLGGVTDAVNVIRRDEGGAVIFHRVIVVFYGLWISGEPIAASDVSAAQWRQPQEIPALETTAGLQEVVRRAWLRLRSDALFHGA